MEKIRVPKRAQTQELSGIQQEQKKVEKEIEKLDSVADDNESDLDSSSVDENDFQNKEDATAADELMTQEDSQFRKKSSAMLTSKKASSRR